MLKNKSKGQQQIAAGLGITFAIAGILLSKSSSVVSSR